VYRKATLASGLLGNLDVCIGYIYYTYMGSKFDPEKDASNIAKHGLSLVEGEGVLNDPLGLTVEDGSSEGESRWITVGMNAGGEILVVVWTELTTASA
jgi:uncharacterized DUF497 family protein